jgi:hypothetical protein
MNTLQPINVSLGSLEIELSILFASWDGDSPSSICKPQRKERILVTVYEALYGAHAEVCQLHVEQTTALLNLVSDGVIHSRAEIGELQRLMFGHGAVFSFSFTAVPSGEVVK